MSEESETRKYLYKLEEMGIVVLERTKEREWYNYSWKLTQKGMKLVESNKKLKEFFEKGKIKEFYEKLENLRN